MSNKRFQIQQKEGTFAGCKIIVDSETGVNYLFSWDGYAGGITALLDKDGKPIITTVNK